MRSIFESIIASYLDSNIGSAEHFLDATLATSLRSNLLELYNDQQLTKARIGNKSALHQNETIRTDLIYWLDKAHGNVAENSFFDHMDQFVAYLNATCYTRITNYEFHYAMYEAGSFYKRHLDQFKTDQGRAFSMIMYLNENWQEGDGGELQIFLNEDIIKIAPLNCRSVFFKSSELEHEVILSHKPRMSITGWLRTD